MGTSKKRDDSAAMEGVRRRFEKWRRTHRTGARIPDSLWADAVRAADVCGVHRTAKALRLDYYSLKKRVERQTAATPVKRNAGPTFVELAAPDCPTLSVISSSGCECIVELDDATGAKMRVSLKGIQAPDLAALCRSLWK